jgi:hypothetical protein
VRYTRTFVFRSFDRKEFVVPDKRKRRMTIRKDRKKHAKRVVEAGAKKSVVHKGGKRKVRFSKAAE